MKKAFFISLSSLALAVTALAQTPTPPPDQTPTATIAVSPAQPVVTTPTVAPVVPAAASVAPVAPSVAPASTAPDNEEDFDKIIERKIDRHFRINVDGDDFGHVGDAAWMAVPIVLIVFASLVAVPVLLVSAILFFANSRNRNLHKTVRLMVEKGQPVPEALLNPPPVVRQRSDLRRGVVLCMVGAGIMVFLGAMNDWEGGAWSIGFIPFIIGLGYLLVWKLDVRKEESSPRV